MGRKKIFVMLWASHVPILNRIKDDLNVELDIATDGGLDSQSDVEMIVDRMRSADATILYRHNTDFMDRVDEAMAKYRSECKIISLANDPSMWGLTTVDHADAVQCFMYMQASGDENFRRLFDFIDKRILGSEGEPLPPLDIPYEAVVDIDDSEITYLTTKEYLEAKHIDTSGRFVGIIASRPSYMADGLCVERALAKELRSLGVTPILIYCMFSKRSDLGTRSHIECIKDFFYLDGEMLVDAMVKFSTAFIRNSKYDNEPDPNDNILAEMNIPVYAPIIMNRMSVEEWEASNGLTSDIVWQVSFPEFEGLIGPYVIASDIGFVRNDDLKGRTVIPERCRRVAERISNDISLRYKPNSEKKILIFLNNFPCYGVEANVGNAAGLDTLESVADIMKRLKADGYTVEPPEDGKELIDLILKNKALSEFRWTTTIEMKKCGGVIHEMDVDEYQRYFDTLTKKARDDIVNTWGEPPGKAMVLDDKIQITGVNFGNVMVVVQPKRGCFGAKCDGQACKILHDPACPPTHQYIATYHYYEHIWGADVVIHTGTHGSMEWTPGKGVGLTESCYPDICMSNKPHLYIYNSDNPSEGLVAKRRSYATLIDHMQHLMVGVNLYGGYEELDHLLDEYGSAANDPTHSEELRKLILKKVSEIKMDDLGIGEDTPLKECVRRCHEELSKLKNSQMNKGMHIFGRMPSGNDLVDGVNSIVRYGEEHDSLRDVISDMMGYDLSILYKDQGELDPKSGKSYGSLINEIGKVTRTFVGSIIEGKDVATSIEDAGLTFTESVRSDLEKYRDMILDVADRITSSDEVGSLMNGIGGGFIEPGPSGYITRGRYDIMPTGRNFYSMDPYSVPTRSAWNVGVKMADSTIQKYIDDTGSIPESIGFFWTMGELIATGGELMSELFYLIGVKPVWRSDGRVMDFEIMSLEELGRPRIDVTINVSCILRDNMLNAIDLMDRAISSVATLDEPDDMNFVRKHTMESISEGMSTTDAVARMFGAPPGTYTSGVNLAVFASAWKDDKDLADVYVKTKGHGYGGGRNGKPMYEQFATVLSKTDITFDRTTSDETDLLSCSCHFSNIGGMAVATRYLSGKDVKTYYADTRDPRDMTVGTLAEEFRRSMRTKTFNPEWIEAMKQHGYKGANDMSKRIVRLFGWQATTHEVDDWLFDEVVNVFVNDDEMREFFEKNNPYAFEEMTRRLLEAHSRGLWDADEESLKSLQEHYLDIESMLEDAAGDGEFQGGSVDIYSQKDVGWDDHGVSNMTDSIRKRKTEKR